MVQPENGTMFFQGLQTGKTYAVDFYCSDVAAAAVTFELNGAAGAASQSFFTAPENMVLRDVSIATGLTAVTNCIMTINGGIMPGAVIRFPNFLNTLNNRPKMALAFNAGAMIGARQNA